MLTEDEKRISAQIDKFLLSKIGGDNQNEPVIQLAERVLNNYRNVKGNLNPPIDSVSV